MPEGQDPQNPSQDPQQQQGQGPGEGGETPQSWEEVLQGLNEEAKKLYETHTAGLKSALDSEREQRKELAAQLREATKELEEGSEARQQLEKLAGQLEEAERRADFYEEAAARSVANPKLAYIVAREAKAFDKRGNVDWDALKEQFPELFKPPRAPGNAGAGTGSQPAPGFDMDRAIRKAAGRG